MAKETLVGGFANIVVTSKVVVMGDGAVLQNVAQTFGLPHSPWHRKFSC